MDGRAVFRWAVDIVCGSIGDVLAAAKLTSADVDLFVLHQANIRIINSAMEHLHIPHDKVFNNLEKYGNTSGGSIPIALEEAAAAGKLKPGMTVVLSGFGAGLAWGTAVLKW